ncbi:putative sugar transferase EpsL (plasmid) [Maritalea myrionectae]|uniref:Putative sugar transferase EpsL n=1 Tax=Maritalea myrionectae TaxID=454601 RepID=A0A2R4MJF0_9HYPH|nr:sugar transferase [Maritalea myrionectae]AVX06127.1 putative sugar transferase EpsL [Maritalea myrionectae]
MDVKRKVLPTSGKNLYVVGCCLLIGFIATLVNHFWVFGSLPLPPKPQFINSLVASIVATLLAHMLYREATYMPGPRPRLAALSTLTICFSIALFVLFIFRIEYSRVVIFTYYIVDVFWYTFVAFYFRTRYLSHIGYFNDKTISRFSAITGIRLIKITERGYLKENALDAVVFDLTSDLKMGAWVNKSVNHFKFISTPIWSAEALAEQLSGRVDVSTPSQVDQSSNRSITRYVKVRAFFEKIVAVCVLPFVLVLFSILFILIKLDDGGPLFFTQLRMGQGRKPFLMLKIRTMAGDKPSDDVSSNSSAFPSLRITRVGRWLRRLRIDELPQILNILRGEMSWIGPRPHPIALSNQYNKEIAQYELRYLVPPGITGWAQVNQGHVNEINEVRTKLSYDLFYVKNISLRLDIFVVYKTIRVIITGFGAR